MEMKRKYERPFVVGRVTMQLEKVIAGSVISGSSKVETVGQEVESKDFTNDGTLNHEWN